jgi:hypothetical protein
MNFGTSWLTRMRIAPNLFIADRLPNMTFSGPARDTVLTNRQTEKLNFDTNYITIAVIRVSTHERRGNSFFSIFKNLLIKIFGEYNGFCFFETLLFIQDQ